MDTTRKDDNVKKDSNIFTKETFGMLLVLFSTLCFICLLTRGMIFSSIGEWVSYFLLGVFGYSAYVQCLLCIYLGVTLVIGKSIPISTKMSIVIALFYFAIIFLLHGITSASFSDLPYGRYVGECYLVAKDGIRTATGGGLIAGFFVYWGLKLFTKVGFYIIISAIILSLGAYLVKKIFLEGKFIERGKVAVSSKKSSSEEETTDSENATQQTSSYSPINEIREDVDNLGLSYAPKRPTNSMFIAEGAEFATLGKRESSANIKLNSVNNGLVIAGAEKQEESTVIGNDLKSKIEYIKKPQPLDLDRTLNGYNTGKDNSTNVSKPILKEDGELKSNQTHNKRTIYTDFSDSVVDTSSSYSANDFTVNQDNSIRKPNIFTNGFNYNKPIENEVEKIEPIIPDEKVVEEKPSYIEEKPSYTETNNRYAFEEKVETPAYNPMDFDEFSEKDVEDAFDKESVTESVPTYNNYADEPIQSVETVEENEITEEDLKDAFEVMDSDFSATESVDSSSEEVIENYNFDNDDKGQEIPEVIEENVEEKPLKPTADEYMSEVYGPLETFVETPIPEKTPTPRVRQTVNERVTPSNVPSYTGAVTNYTNYAVPTPRVSEEKKVEKVEKPKVVEPINRPYHPAPLDYLIDHAKNIHVEEEDHHGNIIKIVETLAAFGINLTPEGYIQGPAITRYQFSFPINLSLKKISNYEQNLNAVLEVKDGIRILAPIPGKNLIGIEKANKTMKTVSLREVYESTKKKEKKKSDILFSIGKSIVGEPIDDNLAKGPHYLVAGSTGSGKSVFLNSMIISLIMRYSPEELKLILIDPKTVEFKPYEHLPHLVIDEIISDHTKVLAVLDWAYKEMERRYAVFRESGRAVVDIEGYNEMIAGENVQRMARIVIIVDELADLMQNIKKDLEKKIAALTAKARSAGIHLVLATQRPSVDVITGVIKANLPTRVAFKVTATQDAITIHGEAGAEKLLGKGDMLYKNSTMSNTERFQGTFITPQETNDIVEYIIKKNKAYFNDELSQYLEDAVHPPVPEKTANTTGLGSEADENMFIQAVEFLISGGNASISSLQRRFRIGFSKAGNFIDRMTEMGFVSANEGTKVRKVLITKEKFDELYGNRE